MIEKIVLADAFARIAEPWSPQVAAALNGQEVRLAKLAGPFVWHKHDDADELFLGVAGTFRIELRDGSVTLGPGELVVVPRGVEHRPVADGEALVLLFEPAGTRPRGDA